jgi:ubiquinone/menaquinone biosynthesis C-methylase UbiE
MTEPTRWERAYQAFETPQAELEKFLRRLRSIGADRWDRRSRIVEVCSGRGNGLRAWAALGFSDIVGVDFSHALVKNHSGPGLCVLGDARALPLATGSHDVVVIQGGLHHLLTIDDVDRALAEMRRVATPDGTIVIVEPWRTPFLRLVHAISAMSMARRLSPKLDAFETMYEEERVTYDRWLNAPETYMRIIRRYVAPAMLRRRWGKLVLVGRPVKR